MNQPEVGRRVTRQILFILALAMLEALTPDKVWNCLLTSLQTIVASHQIIKASGNASGDFLNRVVYGLC
jgi:hypothetical protein